MQFCRTMNYLQQSSCVVLYNGEILLLVTILTITHTFEEVYWCDISVTYSINDDNGVFTKSITRRTPLVLIAVRSKRTRSLIKYDSMKSWLTNLNQQLGLYGMATFAYND